MSIDLSDAIISADADIVVEGSVFSGGGDLEDLEEELQRRVAPDADFFDIKQVTPEVVVENMGIKHDVVPVLQSKKTNVEATIVFGPEQ